MNELMWTAAPDRYLSYDEQRTNAAIIWNYFTDMGWSIPSICALLGNMQSESSINPGIWQDFKVGDLSVGYGLVQWTPATKIQNWILESYGFDDYDNGDFQIRRIQWELENGVQWSVSEEFPYTFYEFTRSEKQPAYLADMFMVNYEQPLDTSEEARKYRRDNADFWYRYFTGKNPPHYPLSPLLLLYKYKKRRFKR